MLACHQKDQGTKVSIQPDPLIGRQVVLTVPDGFSGVLKIVKNSDRGVELRADNDRIEIPFGSDGVYTVKSFQFLEEPHSLHARFSSGSF